MNAENFKKLIPEQQTKLESVEKTPEDQASLEDLQKQFEQEVGREMQNFHDEDAKVDQIIENVGLENQDIIQQVTADLQFGEKLKEINSEAENAGKFLERVKSDPRMSLDDFAHRFPKDITSEERDFIKSEYVQIRSKLESIEESESRFLAEKAYQYISERAQELGIKVPEFSFDKHYDRKEKSDVDSGHASYDRHSNTVSFREGVKFNLPTIIHEQLHFSNSEKNRDYSSVGNRTRKIGFASSWQGREEGEIKDILRGFNEAVTEKLAQDLFVNNKEKFMTDSDDFLKLEEERKELINSSLDIKTLYDFQSRDFEDDLELLLLDEESDMAVKKENFYKEIHAKNKQSLLDFKNRVDLVTKNDIGAYKPEIAVLDSILEKLAIHKSETDKITKEEALKQEWKDLQKAYLNGNTLYLKKIEHVIGAGTLRSFNELQNRSRINGELKNIKNSGQKEEAIAHLMKKIEKS